VASPPILIITSEWRCRGWSGGTSACCFFTSAKKAPRDVRFLVERAGAEYKLSDFRTAKCDLRQALRLDAQDPYVAEFLGTIYLLEANLEAALKYWNHVEKPRLTAVEAVPSPKTEKRLFDRAITFSPPEVLERKSFLRTNALLENLDVFPQWRTELSPALASENAETTKRRFA